MEIGRRLCVVGEAELSRGHSLRRGKACRRGGPAGLRELLCGHGLGEEKPLHQIKTQLPHGEKIRPRFHALGHRTCAIAVGEVEDAAAGRLFQAIVGAAVDEFPINLDLDEGELVESG